MAEILLSLTIIGVVAAITLPSLTGNINERTWNTQRKALYARMSQAIALMPSLNGYGSTLDNHAEVFITSGLSKVLKMNNICDKDNLFDCGFASQYTDGAGSQQNLPTEVKSLNTGIITIASPISIKNTKAAAFETANGESILTFYNPNCADKNVYATAYNNDGSASSGNWAGETVKQHVCANFMYDLNGSKGPNTVGKDIGTISVFYSSDPVVVMPMYPKAVSGSKNHSDAAKACRALDSGQYRLPNIEEAISVYYNRLVYSTSAFGSNGYIWSGTSIDANSAYAMGFSYGIKYPRPKSSNLGVFCVER